jgi:integrase
VRKFAENKRTRRLSDAEYAALGTALAVAADEVPPHVLDILRFLALTGWRSGEALNLCWRDIDLVRRIAVLPDTKSGRSLRPLSHAASAVLRAQPRINDALPVFPAVSTLPRNVRQVANRGGLPADVSAHTLRHSFASLAADLGYSEPTIAMLIGHVGRTMTSRYLHGADAVMLAAADAVADAIAGRLAGTVTIGTVIPLRTKP